MNHAFRIKNSAATTKAKASVSTLIQERRFQISNFMLNQQDLIVINILFFIRIVKLWNELPGDIVEADSFQLFKSKLKLYLNN